MTTTALPTTLRGWNALLRDLDVRPSKGRGQNFLYERGIVGRIVKAAGVDAGSTVIEVGPGLGILTEALAQRAHQVIGIEVDPRLADHLRHVFNDDSAVHIVNAYALSLDIGTLVDPGEPYQVVANLPYNVASAVIRHCLEQAHPPRRMTVMVQKEVSERMVAAPPEMSVLGVAVQFYAAARIAFTVPPSVFFPPPKIDSSVVVLDPHPQPPIPRERHRRFFRIVNAGFRHKRKTIANSLATELQQPKAAVEAWLRAASIDPIRRAETLSVPEWIGLEAGTPAGWLP